MCWLADTQAFLLLYMGKKGRKGEAMSTDVLLVALNAKFSHTNLALRYLRESCLQAGLGRPKLLELTINNYIPEMLGQIFEYQPRIIGFSCYIWNIQLIKQLLPLLRKVLPETVLICGGPEVSYESQTFLQELPCVDFVVRGEAEQAFPALVQQLQAADYDYAKILGKEFSQAFQLPGVAYLDKQGQYIDGGVVDLPDLAADTLPFAYEAEEMAELRERILYYETSRGCPFSCAYCLSCATAGVRYRSWELVHQELQFFVDNDVRQVKLVDRTFNAMKRHYWPILQFIQDLPESCRTNFHFEVAVDYLDEETIQLLQSLPRGRVQLEIGIQSTNPEVLRRIQRTNHWDRIASNIRALLVSHNMHVHTDLIIGLPGEDMASFKESFNRVYGLDTDMLQLGFLKFLKGAAMMELVEEYDYQYMDIGPYEVLSNSCLTYGEIHWLHIFEEVFELYHNAGRCRRTCNYLIAAQEAGDAFAFYAKLTDYWQAKGYQHQPHGAKNLYGLLQAFIYEVYGAQAVEPVLLDNLLRFDALLADGGKIRPEQLNWNLETYQKKTAAFWRNQGDFKAVDYLPDFVFTTWRDIRRCYQLERFEYPVHQLQAGQTKPEPTWILFDFTQGDTVYRVIEKFEG